MTLRTLLFSTILLAACSQAPVTSQPPPAAETPPPATDAKKTPVACTEPRPQVCTAIYDPVCATRDTGVRCVTTPCPSTEQKTMGSSCSACSDPKVLSWVPGECPAAK